MPAVRKPKSKALRTCRYRENHDEQAGSRISSFPSPSADRRAWTPNGSVSIGRAVCPTGAPNTIGTPSGAKIRVATSFTLSVPGGGLLSGKSPRTTPVTPRSLPACFRCINARSTCQGFMARSSRTRIAPRVSSSHGVPIVASTKFKQPPRSVPSLEPALIDSPLSATDQPFDSANALSKLSGSYPSGASAP